MVTHFLYRYCWTSVTCMISSKYFSLEPWLECKVFVRQELACTVLLFFINMRSMQAIRPLVGAYLEERETFNKFKRRNWKMCQMVFVVLLADFMWFSAAAVSNVILNQFAIQLLTHFTNPSLRSTNQLSYLALRLLIHYVVGTLVLPGFCALHCPLSLDHVKCQN